MTLATDPHGGSYARAGASWAIGGDRAEATRCLVELTPAQHAELERVLASLLGINAELADQKQDTGRRAMAAALLCPDDPTLPEIPDGVEGFHVLGVHTTGVRP